MQSRFPIEEVARRPEPGMAVPAALAFSPDDRLLTYLHSPEATLERRLFGLDLDTGTTSVLFAAPETAADPRQLTLEEELRRQRRRDLSLGVTRYAWAKDAPRILLPLPDGLHVLDPPDGDARLVVAGDLGPLLDPKLSPDGSLLGFVRDAEIHVVALDREGHESTRPLTEGAAAAGVTHGLAEFIAQEEMGRPSGWWWSRAGDWIAFTEVDERPVDVFPIPHLGEPGSETGGAPVAVEEHRYPFAGRANAVVRLAVVPVAGGAPRWLDLGPLADDGYLARVDWMPDGSLFVQVEDRLQRRLVLYRFDPATGDRTTVLEETTDVWINLHDLLRPVGDGGRFVWGSERTGFRHLYLDGETPITSGEWVVETVEAVDEDAGVVYVTGTADGARQRHLYSVPLEGGVPRRVTAEPGLHHVVVDHAALRYVDTASALDRPPTVTVRRLADSAPVRTVHDTRDPRIDALGLHPPEPVTVANRHGDELYGLFYRPPSGPPPWPTVVYGYGGPGVQLVTDGWGPTAGMQAQYLRQSGVAVFVLDNRGSARRGVAFESVIRGDLGHHEVEDQVDGVRWLVEEGLADVDRVAICGWSYGGYLAAMALAQAPDTFGAAVAGAPVTAWDGYDTHYTERYMGLPADNAEGYERSQVMHHVAGVQGRLLLVHGLLDENVHFRHTARLVEALVEHGRPYELLVFPSERHMPRRASDRVYLERRVCDFLLAALGPAADEDARP